MGRVRRGRFGALESRSFGGGRRHPMFRDACIPEHWVNIISPESRGLRFRYRPARRPVHDLLRNRRLSFPVSMISQWCAGWSSASLNAGLRTGASPIAATPKSNSPGSLAGFRGFAGLGL